MTQAESLVEDDELRQAIKTNAKKYIETSYNTAAEFQEYSRLASSMSRPCRTRTEVVSEDDGGHIDAPRERKTRVRFQFEDEKKTEDDIPAKDDSVRAEAPDSTKKAQSSRNMVVIMEERDHLVEETPNKELENDKNESQPTLESKKSVSVCPTFNVTSPDDEENKPESLKITSEPDSTAEAEEKQPAKTEVGEDSGTKKVDVVEQPSAKLWATPVMDIAKASTPSPSTSRSVKAGLHKTDSRKNVTASSSRPGSSASVASVGKSRTASGKSGHKQPVVRTLSDNEKKMAAAGVKKTAVRSTSSVDKALLKEPSPHRSASRTASDSAAHARKTKK